MFKLIPMLFAPIILLTACAQVLTDSSGDNSSTATASADCDPVSRNLAAFNQLIKLDDGRQVVISEGLYEPRSIGSVTVLLYRDLEVGDFDTGLSFARDGFVTAAVLDGARQLKITTTSAGSGSYQRAYFVCIDNNALKLCNAGQ